MGRMSMSVTVLWRVSTSLRRHTLVIGKGVRCLRIIGRPHRRDGGWVATFHRHGRRHHRVDFVVRQGRQMLLGWFAFLERDTGESLSFSFLFYRALVAAVMISVPFAFAFAFAFAFVGNPPGSWRQRALGVFVSTLKRSQASRQLRHGDRRHHGHAVFILVLTFLVLVLLRMCHNWRCRCERHCCRHGWHGRIP
jgi:hypothetical protein